jgi:hypothetical protein
MVVSFGSIVAIGKQLLANAITNATLADFATIGRSIHRAFLSKIGLYAVLNHQASLTLHDNHGECATVHKKQRVRYLQNHTMAYQDEAWGDGEILQNYQCSPGIVADQYTPDQKTYILISLREPKKRGDVDEFDIQWQAHNGFVREYESWSIDINHHTTNFDMAVIFPKDRPPLSVHAIEQRGNKQKKFELHNKMRLSDGRWKVVRKIAKPRLNSRYTLRWHW